MSTMTVQSNRLEPDDMVCGEPDSPGNGGAFAGKAAAFASCPLLRDFLY
jgi:hypothetical protein